MSNAYDEQVDLNLVAKYFLERGLTVERFSIVETQRGRTPDFRVCYGKEVVAYCEIKAPNDPWLDDLLNKAPPLTIVGGGRPDPVFNRIARLLNKAVTQFMAVNQNHEKLNILAYVNHDDNSHYGDLYETITGFFHAEDGKKYATMMNIAEGVIGETKRQIDAFLWFESRCGRLAGILISQEDSERTQRVCSLLQIDVKSI